MRPLMNFPGTKSASLVASAVLAACLASCGSAPATSATSASSGSEAAIVNDAPASNAAQSATGAVTETPTSFKSEELGVSYVPPEGSNFVAMPVPSGQEEEGPDFYVEDEDGSYVSMVHETLEGAEGALGDPSFLTGKLAAAKESLEASGLTVRDSGTGTYEREGRSLPLVYLEYELGGTSYRQEQIFYAHGDRLTTITAASSDPARLEELLAGVSIS